MTRWNEYTAGTLPFPAVVQSEPVTGGHFLWVAIRQGTVRGPYFSESIDPSALERVVAIATADDVVSQEQGGNEFVVDDGEVIG